MCEIYFIKLSISTLQYMMVATGYQINEAKHQQNVRCVALLRTHPFLSLLRCSVLVLLGET